MNGRKLRVLVVGAGASGLPAIKTALEYGFSVVCMEKSNDIGGLWRYKENAEPGQRAGQYLHGWHGPREHRRHRDGPRRKHARAADRRRRAGR